MSGGDDDFARWADLHSRQLAAMGLPDAYWRMLHASVREQRFDAGAWVQFAMDEEGELYVLASCDIAPAPGGQSAADAERRARLGRFEGSPAPEPEPESNGGAAGLMLLDHAWSFASIADAKQSLKVVDGLLLRVHELFFPAVPAADIAAGGEAAADAAAARVIEALESRVGWYTTAGPAEAAAAPTFFVLDEVGARMGQSDEPDSAQPDAKAAPERADVEDEDEQDEEQEEQEEAGPRPNYRCEPFFSLDERVAYSVAWPCAALSVGDELVVSTAAAKAAWAKLNDHSTSGGQAEAAHADALPAEFVEYQTKLQSKAMEEQLARGEDWIDSAAIKPTARNERAHVALTAEVLREFATKGVVVVDRTMPTEGSDGATALRGELERWVEKHPLQPASVDGDRTDARQDVIGWMTSEQAVEAGEAASAAVALLQGVAFELNTALGLGLAAPHQMMCACYDGNGARYVAHKDNVCVDADGNTDCTNTREVTAILYTSEGWQEEDGGCLRFYHHSAGSVSGPAEDGEFTDVAPLAGRLVVFRSRTILHEVLPSYARRTALSMWLVRFHPLLQLLLLLSQERDTPGCTCT
jgi:SM-20-related protein